MDFKVFGGLLKDDVTKALLSGENFDAYTGKIIEFAELEAVTDSILVE